VNRSACSSKIVGTSPRMYIGLGTLLIIIILLIIFVF
jgi:hypothetical protein